MIKLLKKSSKKIGAPPGTLVYVGEKRVEKVKITLIDYDQEQYQEKEVASVEECFPFKDKPTITWINVDGLHQIDIIEKLGKHFDLHPLILEDLVHTGQRPKIEDMGSYIFIVIKMLGYDEQADEITAEQVSLILGSNFVITFQEKEGDVFDPIRDRIRNSKGRIRKTAADYLAYALIDTIIDCYFTNLEKIGDKIEALEEELLLNGQKGSLHAIHRARSNLIFLRKSVWPLRELAGTLERGESPLIDAQTKLYFRDVYDHAIQAIDTVETMRELVAGMHDVYLSNVSNKMNEVMKVLTIIATLFIPTTFLAGIYGMNFKFMPELNWRYGYLMVWIIIVIIIASMLLYFKKKKWL